MQFFNVDMTETRIREFTKITMLKEVLFYTVMTAAKTPHK